ncbi:hypothetical protein EBU58_05615 [bacterium]|nr:hypothetical protein [bacterium]
MTVALFLFEVAYGVAVAAEVRPNILLIVSDDQGYNDLGCLGNGIQTPTLDRLCREGTRLTNFYVAWPACTPSRGALLTGRYPQRNGLYDMIRNEAPDYGKRYDQAEYEVTFERIIGMDTREVLVAQLLKQAGYRTAVFGKWDGGSHRRFLPTSRGFDEFYGFVNTGIDYYTHERYGVPSMYRNDSLTEEDKGIYSTLLFEREAHRFVEQCLDKSSQPFFLYLPFNAPHGSSSLDPQIRSSVQAPEAFREVYPPVAKETRLIEKYRYGGAATVVTPEARQRDYRAAVTCMDASIGKVLNRLESRGALANTIVIFFSDNGGSGGADNKPLRGHKGQVWEGGIRVPCVIRWPQGKARALFRVIPAMRLRLVVIAAASSMPKSSPTQKRLRGSLAASTTFASVISRSHLSRRKRCMKIRPLHRKTLRQETLCCYARLTRATPATHPGQTARTHRWVTCPLRLGESARRWCFPSGLPGRQPHRRVRSAKTAWDLSRSGPGSFRYLPAAWWSVMVGSPSRGHQIWSTRRRLLRDSRRATRKPSLCLNDKTPRSLARKEACFGSSQRPTAVMCLTPPSTISLSGTA